MVLFFFRYRQAFETYYECRLWDVPRDRWQYYYGSNYNSYQRRALAREVQPEDYRRVFQNKAVCAMLCRGIGARIPATYGVVAPTEQYRERLQDWCHDSPTRSLVVKPVIGSSGQGVHLVRERDGAFSVSSSQGTVDMAQFTLRQVMLVQEALRQDERLAAFSASVNTIRVVTMLSKAGEAFVVYAFIRFGVGSACVDNFSAGGVAARLDVGTGDLLLPVRDKQNRLYACHPTSATPFAGFRVPNWQGIVSFALTIQRSFDFYRLLGLDIALAADGEPVLIEVNASTDLDGVEAGPLLADDRIVSAFGEYGLLVSKAQERVYADAVGRHDGGTSGRKRGQ